MSDARDIGRRMRTRGLWWSLFAALVVLELIVVQLHLPMATESLVSYIITYFTPMFLTVGAAFLLASRVEGVERRFWGLLGVAVAAIIVPEVYWTYYETLVDFRGPQVPNWFELGHLAGITIFCLLVVSMTEFGEAPIVTRLRTYLDAFGGLVVAFVAIYWFWTLPLFVGLPMGGWPVAVIAAFYPVSGAVMLLTTALVVFGWKAYRWRTWERLVSFAFGMYGIGLFTFPNTYAGWVAAPVPHGFDPYTIVLGFGFYLLFMAIVYRFTAARDAVRAEPWPIPAIRPPWLPMLYPSLIALAMLFVGWASLRVANLPGGGVIVASTAALALVLIVRSWLSSVELAHHRARSISDDLTGAFNQRHLYERLPRELAEAVLAERSVAALAFDIVDFRSIVRMSGSELGDSLLVQLADLLRAEAPPGSAVYRVGRDEFLAIVVGFSADEAVALARRVNARLASEISIEGIPVALSVGVAVFPDHASDAATLVSRALTSQQLARSAERADLVVFDAEVVDAVDPLVSLERARRQSHRAQLRTLAAVVDARDADTRVHSEVVGEIASAFALVLDLPHAQAQVLETAALVHDIGKIGVPDDVLLKPSELSDAEREIVQRHPLLGERLLRPADMPEVLLAVRHHHERWDGTGYPDRLVGAEIPFEARVLAICDAFEAMTSARRYRSALTTSQALEELERCSGTQFDPTLAEMFARMVAALHGSALSAHIAATRREIGRESF